MGAAPSSEAGYTEAEARTWLGVLFDREALKAFTRHAAPCDDGLARVPAARVGAYTKKRKWLQDRGSIVMENLRQLRRARLGGDRLYGVHFAGACAEILDRPADVAVAADGKHRQVDVAGAFAEDASGLYEVAEHARYVFEGAVGEAVEAADLGEGVAFDSAPLKPRARAEEKAAAEYGRRPGSGFSYVLDVVRGSVTCASEAELLDVWKALEARLDIVKCKNRFVTPNFNGYRDLVLTVRVEAATLKGASVAHFCELQVHVSMVRESEAVLRSYDVYRYLRTFFGEHDGNRGDQESRVRVLLAGSETPSDDVGSLVGECMAIFEDDASSLEHLSQFLKHVDHHEHVPALTARLSTVRKSFVADAAHRRKVERNLRDGGAVTGDGLSRQSLVLEHHESRDRALFETDANVLAAKCMNERRYRDAEPLLRLVLRRFEADLGPDHEHVAAALDNLCLCLRNEGRFAEALPLYARALAVAERRVGPAHEDVAATLGGYAGCLKSLHRADDAVPLYRRAVEIWARHLGDDHLHVAEVLNKLASALNAAGCPEDAVPALLRAAEIRRKRQGPDHGDYATDLAGASDGLLRLGRYAEAEAPLAEALRVWEAQLGSTTHPLLATPVNNLALVLRMAGRWREAEGYYRRALGICAAELGDESDAYANALHNLAAVLEQRGRYGEAEPLYRGALRIREASRGPDDASVADALVDLGALLARNGRYAEPLFRRALKIRERAEGPSSLGVALACEPLAACEARDGAAGPAADLYARALAIKERVLGPADVGVAATLHSLAELHKRRGDYASARPLYERALSVAAVALPPDAPEIATMEASLASLHARQGDFAGAEPLLRKALSIRERNGPVLGFAAVAFSLAAAVRAREKKAEAEDLYRRCLGVYEAELGGGDAKVATVCTALGGLLDEAGRRDEASDFLERALSIRERRGGADAPAVGSLLAHLAQLHGSAGRHDRALVFYRALARLRNRELGRDDPRAVKARRAYHRCKRSASAAPPPVRAPDPDAASASAYDDDDASLATTDRKSVV